MITRIGMDVEFMAFHRGKMVYAQGPNSPQELREVGCDEFGHCIEIRPKQATDEFELIGNIMRAMSALPKKFAYKSLNAVEVPEKEYIDLVRKQGQKNVPECINVYNADILATTDFEKQAIKSNKKVLYCGMHIHVSTAIEHRYEGKNGRVVEEIGLPIPAVLLTQLFDKLIFTGLSDDPLFKCGRYRQPGFYEMKTKSHFEYRSLGSSAFTPERVAIIFRMIKTIVENADGLSIILKDYFLNSKTELYKLCAKLKATKPSSQDLLKIWMPTNK